MTTRVLQDSLRIPQPASACSSDVAGTITVLNLGGSGQPLVGYVQSVDGDTLLVDMSRNSVFDQSVSTVLTYAAGSPSTFSAITAGLPVYWDPSTGITTDLSISPLDDQGDSNIQVGWAVNLESTPLPKGTAISLEVVTVAVLIF